MVTKHKTSKRYVSGEDAEKYILDQPNQMYHEKLDVLKKYIDELSDILKDVYESSNNENMITDLMKNREDDRMLGILLLQKEDFEDVFSKRVETLEAFNYLKTSRVVSNIPFKKI